jgi:3-oxoacyl-[acyl-carrier protein] reductase
LRGKEEAMDLKGKKALVTGGSMGIGKATVIVLGGYGADVAFTYRKHEAEAKAIASEVEKGGGKALAIRADVGSFEDAQKTVDKVKDEWGGFDILVNNAGVNWDGVIWKMTEEQWDTVLEINLKGYFNFLRASVPIFREAKSGAIVNVTSINGLRGKFGQSNYAASKAGIVGLTKSTAKELGKLGIRVNAVAPGLIETEMVSAMPDEAKNASLAEIVLGKLGQPEDVGEVIAFLASDLAKHVTGEVVKVDGGQYI